MLPDFKNWRNSKGPLKLRCKDRLRDKIDGVWVRKEFLFLLVFNGTLFLIFFFLLNFSNFPDSSSAIHSVSFTHLSVGIIAFITENHLPNSKKIIFKHSKYCYLDSSLILH